MLQARLAERGFTEPLRTSERLRVDRSWNWQVLRFLYSHRPDNLLLQAALQHFADDESFINERAISNRDAIQVTPNTVQATAVTGPQTPAVHFKLASERARDDWVLLDLDPFTSRPRRARAAFWRRLRAIDQNLQLRRHVLGQPARELFNMAR